MRWHAVSLHDLYAIIKSIVYASAALSVVIFFFGSPWFVSFPRSVILIDGTITFLLIASLRISRRMFHEVLRGERPKIRPQELRDQTVEEYFAKVGFSLSEERVAGRLEGKTVLVTGAAGSLGVVLSIALRKRNIRRLILLDHNEVGLLRLRQELMRRYGSDLEKISLVIADVRDAGRIERVFSEYTPDIVFHAAAYKHGVLLEGDLEEAVKVNVFGSMYVADSAVEYGAEQVLFLSDIASGNATAVGLTKWLAEEAFLTAAESGTTIFTSLRIGTVLGSRGGVLGAFLRQIERGGPVRVTSKEVKKRMMTVEETVAGILEAFSMKEQGMFLLEGGREIQILELAESLVRLHGLEPYQDMEISVTGLRKGEDLGKGETLQREGTDHSLIFRLFGRGDSMHRVGTERLRSSIETLVQFGAVHKKALLEVCAEQGMRVDVSSNVIIEVAKEQERKR